MPIIFLLLIILGVPWLGIPSQILFYPGLHSTRIKKRLRLSGLGFRGGVVSLILGGVRFFGSFRGSGRGYIRAM